MVLGSLTNDKDNVTNQIHDWLNEEKQSCCTCSTLFGAIFRQSLPNEDVRVSNFRFRRQRKLQQQTFQFLTLLVLVIFYPNKVRSEKDNNFLPRNQIGQLENIDDFICTANAHAQIPDILCQYAPAYTVWNSKRLNQWF